MSSNSILNIKKNGAWVEVPALKGKDGYTPVKGTDYWTDEDKAEIKSYCQNYIDTQILGGES